MKSYLCFFIATFLMQGLLEAADSLMPKTVRIATFNVSLYGDKAGEIRERLQGGRDIQAMKIAAIVQTVRPDVLLLNEIDYDADAATVQLLAKEYFAVSQGGREASEFPYLYSVASNTGVDSGLDLNRNKTLGEGNDCWGYGAYPGQYSMALLSRFPIDETKMRTFRNFLWHQLPHAHKPILPATQLPYYDEATWKQLRLSSKNHIDVPIRIGDETIHVLASHPTPPVFDGDEDRNGCRNHDEIRFWSHYLRGAESEFLLDDRGQKGGLLSGRSFVIMGDLNADPNDGDGKCEAITELLCDVRVRDTNPSSEGARHDAAPMRNIVTHKGDPSQDTANFGRNGNFRVDYVLPSTELKVVDSGVFWPTQESPNRELISASDHRMVWIEVELR